MTMLTEANNGELIPCMCCGYRYEYKHGLTLHESVKCPGCTFYGSTNTLLTPWSLGHEAEPPLWGARRNFAVNGCIDHLLNSRSLGRGLPRRFCPEGERYDWDIDPEFYVENMSHWIGSDRLKDALDILMGYGLFSRRQVFQKVFKFDRVRESGQDPLVFPHARVRMGDGIEDCNRVYGVVEVILEPDLERYPDLNRYSFVQDLMNLMPVDMASMQTEYVQDDERVGIYRGVNRSRFWNAEGGGIDGVWTTVEFEGDRFRRVRFAANAEADKVFYDLDQSR